MLIHASAGDADEGLDAKRGGGWMFGRGGLTVWCFRFKIEALTDVCVVQVFRTRAARVRTDLLIDA